MAEDERADLKIGKAAVEKGFITGEKLEEALRIAGKRGRNGWEADLGGILVDLGFLTAEQLALLREGEGRGAGAGTSGSAAVEGGDHGAGYGRGEDEEGGAELLAPEGGKPGQGRGKTLLDFQARGGDPGPKADTADIEPDDVDTRFAPVTRKGSRSAPAAGTGAADAPPKPEGGEKPHARTAMLHKPGAFIGPYKILSEIGRGGMGVVYKAYDPSLKRIVALKVLISGERASEDAIERFRREAEAVAKLGFQPGIVPVFDIGAEGTLHYFAMHFVDGKSLSKLIDAGELTPRKAMVLAEKVARALHFAHGHGILHRDVKPDNILVDADGAPSLTDFGLAKDTHEDSRLTVSGTAMGTPQYMSPEQADGAVEKIDARSDVYSLGATLYETLAHVPPFTGSSYVNIISKVMNEEVVSPRKHNPAVPRDAETICLKALEKDPVRRYQSSEAFADDIRRFLDGDPISARPASLVYRVSKKVKRNLALFVTSAIAVLLLASGGSYFLAIKPAMDLGKEMAEDTAALDQALAFRLAPEEEASEMFRKANAFHASGRHAECGALCDDIVAKFSELEGRVFKAIPPIRHKELLGETRYVPLRKPMRFPLARSLALKARAKQEAGYDEAALRCWLLAYAQARTSENKEETAVRAPALLQIGRRLLGNMDLERATATFQKLIRMYPDFEDAHGAWKGLGEAFWSSGRFAAASEAFRRAAAAAGDPAGREEALWYCGKCALLSSEVGVPRPKGWVFPGDLEGDGIDEIMAFDKDSGLEAFGLRNGALEKSFLIPRKAVADPGDGEEAQIRGIHWIPFNGPGRGALLMHVASKQGEEIWVRPISADGAIGKPIRGRIDGGINGIQSGDMDGDGVAEVVVSRFNPSYVQVFKSDGTALAEFCRVPTRSYCMGLSHCDLDLDGREEFLVNLSEYSDWQTWRLGLAKDGSPDWKVLSPYRYSGPLLAAIGEKGGPGRLYVQNNSTADDKRVLRSITRDPKYILENTAYRLVPWSEEVPPDLAASFKSGKPFCNYGIAVPSEGLVVADLTFGGRRGFAFIPEDRSKRWAVLMHPAGTAGGGLRAVNVDGEPGAEIMAYMPDRIVFYGIGEPAKHDPAEIAGMDTESENLKLISNPVLATAIEMASMDWKEQALDLFRKAREETEDALEKHRCLLGEADCMIKLGRPKEAAEIFKGMTGTSTFGIAEELHGMADILRDAGEWKDLVEALSRTLASVPLPEQTRAWARDLSDRIAPLTRMKHSVRCIPPDGFDGTYICRNPLKSPGNRDGQGFEFFSDGARGSAFGRMIDYDGGPFKIEARVVLRRLDWTAMLRFGLARAGRRGDPTSIPHLMEVEFNPGTCTNVPAVKATLMPHGVGGWMGWTIQEYPQKFPVEYCFEIEYAPSLERISLMLRDESAGKDYHAWTRASGRLPAGKYCMAMSGSCEMAVSAFEGWFTVKRFEMFTPSPGNAPSKWEFETGSFTLLRAAAALVLGDNKSAFELASRVGPDWKDPDEEIAIAWMNRKAEDPVPAADAGLVAAIARLREADNAGFREKFKAALDADPAPVLWRIGTCFSILRPAEQEAVAKAVLEELSAEGCKTATAVARALRENPGRRPADLRQGQPDAFFASLESVLAQAGSPGGREAALEGLFRFMASVCRPVLVEAAFRDTPLQKRARFMRLAESADELAMSGNLEAARSMLGTLIAEFPDNPRAMNANAWFLITAGAKDKEDVQRGLGFAQSAVEAARREKSPFAQELPMYLDTLARAHFMLGNPAEAVKVQEEAIRLIGPELERSRPEMEKILARYRKAAEEKKE